jgi:hypothetical protein
VTGRWRIPEQDGIAAELELQELAGGALAGKLIVLAGGRAIGEYTLRDGTAAGGALSYRIDPLDPPVIPFIESIGRIATLRVSGGLESRETLLLDVSQECAGDTCLSASGAGAFAQPMFGGEATVHSPFGRSGFIAFLALNQDGAALTGSMRFVMGTTQGGTVLGTLPVRLGAVSDTNVVSFVLDPTEAETSALAETLGCAAPISVTGRLDQGSTLRLVLRQLIEENGEIRLCSAGSFAFTGREVFDDLLVTIPIVVGGAPFDATLDMMQEGSILTGTATIENDLARHGPFTIDDGRLSGGVATFTVRPAEQESLALVRALGSAAPIAFSLRVVGGLSLDVAAAQQCPCVRESLVLSRVRVGL